MHGPLNVKKYQTHTFFGFGVPSSGSLEEQRTASPTRKSTYWLQYQWGRPVPTLVCCTCIPLS